MKIVEEHWFPTPVWFTDLADAEPLNHDLLKAIATLRATTKSVTRSNVDGWHSATDVHKRPEFGKICGLILEAAAKVCQSHLIDPARKPVMDSFWVNINPPGAYNAMHVHPQAVLSGAYYVQVPANSGDLRFQDPRLGASLWYWPTEAGVKTDARHWRKVNYAPRAGRLILFPHWLEHDVLINRSNGERVSISFNIVLKSR